MLQYVAELYTLGEDGKPTVQDSHSIKASDLEEAKRQANEWTMTVAAVLYEAKHVRLRQGNDIVWERPLGTFF